MVKTCDHCGRLVRPLGSAEVDACNTELIGAWIHVADEMFACSPSDDFVRQYGQDATVDGTLDYRTWLQRNPPHDPTVDLWLCPCRECTRLDWEASVKDVLDVPQITLTQWRSEHWPEHYGMTNA